MDSPAHGSNEMLLLPMCHRSQALCALIESDFTLSGAVDLAVKDERFYERLKDVVLEHLGGEIADAA